MDSISAPLKGKVAIVTGGSRGIGASIARTFARHGCTHIAITYTSQRAKAEEVLRSISEVNSNIKTCAIAADLVEDDVGDIVVDQALKDLAVDRIDILVSNAAIVDQASMPPVADMTKAQWDKSTHCYPERQPL
jgi:3-oxoacyl-[acyl-carrier protein] reductase